MTLIDTDDQRDLASSVKRFVAGQAPMSAVRKTIASEASFDPEVWRRLSQDLGVAGLAIPEEYGGAGASWSELVVALRELGAGLVPTPLLATSVLATGTLLALDDEEARREWLPRFAEGTAVGTLAVSEGPRREWAVSDSAFTVADGTLAGTKTAVLNAAEADVLLVPTAEGIFLVEKDAPGLTVTPVESLDLTRGIATVSLERTPGRLLAGDAAAAIDTVAVLADLALATEQAAATKACLDMTTEYAKIRYSFGQPIGIYQGVKHPLADIYTDWALTDAAVRKASESLALGSPTAALDAASARLLASSGYVEAAKMTMLLHGGIGFTWEHDAHLYYRNAITGNVLLGGPAAQQDRVAALLGV
ncbi:acyl-CoA dehydrogenase family protein [Blastococcus goldschmidtiae]|uniref:Acyl-CoA dehydrogenase family protein n=1 Tax=Blastococcus goldschmidtiae TaxID=3075546 RepID=A0ABU2K7G5_9ACTN|nr:acyl-CoA dehydrogenase family protein [Blastococcus sp. DSM 46792]MDT0276144.1 acyl-CoA dehydrogenase family protein [Blastococcus sp. DSM 46792]